MSQIYSDVSDPQNPIHQCIGCGFSNEDRSIIVDHFDTVHLYDGDMKDGSDYTGPKFICVKEPLIALPRLFRKRLLLTHYHAMRRVIVFWFWRDRMLQQYENTVNYHDDEIETGAYCRKCTEIIYKNPGVELNMKLKDDGRPLTMDQFEVAGLNYQMQEKERKKCESRVSKGYDSDDSSHDSDSDSDYGTTR